MPVCPRGHTSEAAGHCDVCGDLIGGAAPAELREAAVCPRCGTPRSGRFCEVDGYDFETGAGRTTELPAGRAARVVPPVPQPRTGSGPLGPDGPSALVRADRGYFDTVVTEMGRAAADLAFPPYCPERRIPLAGDRIRIGRRSTSRAILPEIDLSTPPQDPGVSHLHAVLLARPDGTWHLVDPGSTNGTTVNGGTEPIPVNVPMPLGDGDRIHVGAWTTITLSLQEGPP